jgi:hypothetical protein
MTTRDKTELLCMLTLVIMVLSINAWLLYERLSRVEPDSWRWISNVDSGDTIIEIDGVYFSIKEIEYEE